MTQSEFTAEDVKNLRNSLGMTQKQFAAVIKVNSQAYVSAIETGARGVSPFVALICKNLQQQKKSEKKKKSA